MADQRVCYKCEWTSSPPIQDHYNGTQLNGFFYHQLGSTLSDNKRHGFFYHQLGSTLSDIKRHSRNTQLGSLRPCILYMGYIHINKHTHIYIYVMHHMYVYHIQGGSERNVPLQKINFSGTRRVLISKFQVLWGRYFL